MIKLYTIYTYKEPIFVQFTDLIFLFAFLPLTILVSFFEKSTEYKNFILIISSVLFFTWGRKFAVALVLLTFVIDWGLGLACRKENKKAIRIAALISDAILNLGIFVIFERNGIFDSIETFSFLRKLGTLGVAFYCIRGFSYVFDVFTQRTDAEKNPFCIMTYMVSFPLMAAGPVVRYGDIRSQIRKREITGTKINDGITRLVIGLTKLAVLVPVLEKVELAALRPEEITISGSLIGILCFIAKICCLFAGWCDMAIGMGRLFGFEYPESFKMFSFRGYVTDLTKSFNSTLWKLGDDVFVSPLRQKNRILGFIGMLLCGVAVGAFYSGRINVILAFSAVMLFAVLEELFLKKFFDNMMPLFSWGCSVIVIVFIFAVARFDSISSLGSWASGLVGGGENYLLSVALKQAITENAFVLAAVAVCYLPFARGFFKEKIAMLSSKSTAAYGTIRVLQTVALCVMLVLSIINLAYNAIA